MPINRIAKQQNKCSEDLPDEAKAVTAEAARDVKDHSFKNFVHWASS